MCGTCPRTCRCTIGCFSWSVGLDSSFLGEAYPAKQCHPERSEGAKAVRGRQAIRLAPKLQPLRSAQVTTPVSGTASAFGDEVPIVRSPPRGKAMPAVLAHRTLPAH